MSVQFICASTVSFGSSSQGITLVIFEFILPWDRFVSSFVDLLLVGEVVLRVVAVQSIEVDVKVGGTWWLISDSPAGCRYCHHLQCIRSDDSQAAELYPQGCLLIILDKVSEISYLLTISSCSEHWPHSPWCCLSLLNFEIFIFRMHRAAVNSSL